MRNTLDSARIPRASKLLICGLFLKGRVLAQDGVTTALFCLVMTADGVASLLRIEQQQAIMEVLGYRHI